MTSSAPELAHEVHLAGAADPGDMRSERLGDLDGEGTDVSRRAVDQDPVARLDAPPAPQVLQRQDARLRHGGGLLEAHAGWLVGPRLLGSTGVLGEGAIAELGQVPEDLVAGPECRHASADRFDLSGRVQPEATVPWPAEPGAHPGEHGPAVQVVEVGLVERCRSEADQHLACLHRRRGDLAQLEDIG